MAAVQNLYYIIRPSLHFCVCCYQALPDFQGVNFGLGLQVVCSNTIAETTQIFTNANIRPKHYALDNGLSLILAFF